MQQLFDALAEQPVRLLRSPPGSGKSAFAELLERHGTSKLGRDVWVLDVHGSLGASGGETTIEASIHECTGVSMADLLNPSLGKPRTIIFDDAQHLYPLGRDHPFWRRIKSINSAVDTRVNVVLMAPYCLRTPNGSLGLPVEVATPWSLSLLELDDDETAQFFANYNDTCEANGYPIISATLQDAMQRFCGRHVGLLSACRDMFCTVFKYQTTVTPEREGDFVTNYLMQLNTFHGQRALPRLRDIGSAEAAEIRSVALAGHEGRPLTDVELAAFPHSLITAGIFDFETMGSNIVVRFSSPAMRQRALEHVFRLPSSQ